MIIGYGFRDEHINETIRQAATGGRLRLFIVDPAGMDLLDQGAKASSSDYPDPNEDLVPHVWGASRRGLFELLDEGNVEHEKLKQFLRM